MTVKYLEVRVRNSSAGRAKYIRIKSADNSWYGFDDAMEPVINGINNYLKHYRINNFRSVRYKVERKNHRNATRVFLQGKVIETENPIPSSFFKTTDQIIEYLMKYYVGYYIEAFLFGVYKNYDREHVLGWYYDKKFFDQYTQRKYLLKEAGIIDLDAEYEKYKQLVIVISERFSMRIILSILKMKDSLKMLLVIISIQIILKRHLDY